MMIAITAYNVLKQAGLGLDTGVRLFDWFYARIYLLIVVFAAALMLIQVTTRAPILLSGTLAAAMALVLVALSARHLELSATFPEATRRLRGLRFIFSGRWGRAATEHDDGIGRRQRLEFHAGIRPFQRAEYAPGERSAPHRSH